MTQITNFYPQEGAIYKHPNGEQYVVLLTAYIYGQMGKQIVVYKNSNGNDGPNYACPIAVFGEEFEYVRNV